MHSAVFENQRSDDEHHSAPCSDSSDDDENFSEVMQENVTSMLNKQMAFDEDGASKNLRAYAKSIDI